MPTLSELVITISGNPAPFLGASRAVRAEYRALERDLSIASARLSGNLVGVGRQMTYGLSFPIAAAGLAVAKLSMDFETSLSRIVGLVGISREQVQAWRADIMSLGAQTGKAPKELAEALYFITSSGLDASQAMDVLTLSAKASAAGLGETQKVADALSSIMNAYKGTTLTAAQATDILVATVREGKAEADAIAGSIGHVAAIASEMGISFNDMGAAIASLTRVGLDSSESVTALKRVLTTLINPSKEGEKALKAFGLSAAELRKEAQTNLIGALFHIKTAMGGNIEAVDKVFGSMKSLTGIMSLTGRQGKDVVNVFNNLRNTSGELDKAFNAVSETMGFKVEKAFAKLKVAGIEMGDAIAPIIGELAELVSGLAKSFEDLTQPQQRSIAQLALFVVVAGPALLIMGEMARTGKILYDTFILMRTAQVALGIRFGATAAEALKLGNVLQYMWIAATPHVGLLLGIAAVAGAVYLVKQAYDSAHKSVEQLRDEQQQENRDDMNLARVKKENAKNVKILVDRYIELKKETHLTTEKQKEMRDILSKINALAPELITNLGQQANKLDLVADAASRATGKYKDLYIAYNASSRQVATDELDSLQRRRQELLAQTQRLTSGRGLTIGPSGSPMALPGGDPGYQNYLERAAAAVDAKEKERILRQAEQYKNQRILDLTEEMVKTEAAIKSNEDKIKKLKDPTWGISGDITSSGVSNRKNVTTKCSLCGKKRAVDRDGICAECAKAFAPYNPSQTFDTGKIGASSDTNNAAKDGERLIADYNSQMQDLIRTIDLMGSTSHEASLQWDLLNGSLSRTAEDGTKISDEQKQALLLKAQELDKLEKIQKATDLFKTTTGQLNKELMISNSQDPVVIANAERKFGIYKDLGPLQWAIVRGLIAQRKAQDETNKAHEEEQQRIREKTEAMRSLQTESMNYYTNLREQIRTINDVSEEDKVNSLFGAGGKFESLKKLALPFGVVLDFFKMVKTAAQELDAAMLKRDNEKDVAAMKEELAMLGLQTNYEKELWRITKGRYKDLSEDQKEARLNAAKDLDEKERYIESEKAYRDALVKTRDEARKLRLELIGMTLQDRINEIMRENTDKKGNPLLNLDRAKQLALEEQRIERLRSNVDMIKKVADGIADIFEDMIHNLWENGFKGLFSNIVKGFQAMLREMAIEYLKSIIRKAVMGLLFRFLGGAGGGGSSNPDGASDAGGLGVVTSVPMMPNLQLALPGGSGMSAMSNVFNSASPSAAVMGDPLLGSRSSSSVSNTTNNGHGVGVVNIVCPNIRDSRDLRENTGQIMGQVFRTGEYHAKRNGTKGAR